MNVRAEVKHVLDGYIVKDLDILMDELVVMIDDLLAQARYDAHREGWDSGYIHGYDTAMLGK